MVGEEWRALEALKFTTVHVADDVWQPTRYHVDALYPSAIDALLKGLDEADGSQTRSPIGVVLQGQKGTGKTHLMGWLRDRTEGRVGYFFLLSLLDARSFWESMVITMVDGFSRIQGDGDTQLQDFLRHLANRSDIRRLSRQAITGNRAVTPAELDEFVDSLRQLYPQVVRPARDTLRALVLLGARSPDLQDIGEAFLCSVEGGDPAERARWGIRNVTLTPQEVVRDVSRLLALVGPSVIAVDQIDHLFNGADLEQLEPKMKATVEHVGNGLMSLREVTHRTLTVVTCLPTTWILIKKAATNSVQDRFREATVLKRIATPDVGRELFIARTAPHYAEVGFEPPYPTWPIRPEAFESAPDYTARQVLSAAESHVRHCLHSREITELGTLHQTRTVPEPARKPAHESKGRLQALDTRFAMLADAAEVEAALDPSGEDLHMPALLDAGLKAWIAARGPAGEAFSIDSPPSAKPPLHGRLRLSIDAEKEDEAHWAFRAIATPNAIAALTRIRNASVASGLNDGVAKRRLFLLRQAPWGNGARTREVLAAFAEAGGLTLRVEEDDLKILTALQALIAENPPGLKEWFADRRPADGVKFLHEALGDIVVERFTQGGPATASQQPPSYTTSSPDPTALEEGSAAAESAGGGPSFVIGRTLEHNHPVTVDIESLRKHTAIFAGSGSGKTVLIRRIIEECAIQGVSSIVLDPNNDLARLGDAWPREPAGWADGDAARATAYLGDTDVVVWTPRRSKGRPLAFQPLPDFAGVRDDVDEFRQAVDAAVATLAPRARVDGTTQKAEVGRAVLLEAVTEFGKSGGGDLNGLIRLLSDLPDGVSSLANAHKTAQTLSELLLAATITDPLFGGEGTPVDPGVLLTPAKGKRARVSVISFVGLQSDQERQSFVNQLQMALFAWIKKNPAGDRPLGGLLIMDEAQTFAPSGRTTPCTLSTLALVSQARKYGLGLVFATQAPKGLHNQIPGNAATQFFGLLNSPVHIEAAKEMARAKGGRVDDIGRLTTGQFYIALEGTAPRRSRTPLCLTHHPRAPLTTEEVIERAGQ